MDYNIVDLPKEQWKGYVLPIGYTTEEYYDVAVDRNPGGFAVTIEKKRFPSPVTHSQEEYGYPDKLYEDHWEGALARGVLVDGKLIGAIEIVPETWSNRLRVTELWVAPEYQKQGLGRALMDTAKDQARREGRRTVILETQSCNVNAVDFYLHQGFTLIGFDACCYKNDDLQRKEVRLEMGWYL